MLPSEFKPKTLNDFIGSAQAVGRKIEKLLAAAVPAGAPLKVMLLGNPGIGKTALGNWFQTQLAPSDWDVQSFNGTQLKIETVEEIAHSFHYLGLGYRLLRIEEVDKVPVVAQVRFLSLLDDLPRRGAIFCTSNCKARDLEERFQSRFIIYEVKPPSQSEIESLLARVAAGLPKAWIPNIAMAACGNVRQALLDATHACYA